MTSGLDTLGSRVEVKPHLRKRAAAGYSLPAGQTPTFLPLMSQTDLSPVDLRATIVYPERWNIWARCTTGRPCSRAVSRSVIQVVPKSAPPETTVCMGD